MADGETGKKKHKHPYGAFFWGAVASVAVFRALYHPWRALLKDGFASRCAGDVGPAPRLAAPQAQYRSPAHWPPRADTPALK